ncbi:Hypothetical protein D9617_7g030180 [Elsinoe fawcettii]|nr:Hypothetical protein D9617_7g030180 [Elsinoe fawcettii]
MKSAIAAAPALLALAWASPMQRQEDMSAQEAELVTRGATPFLAGPPVARLLVSSETAIPGNAGTNTSDTVIIPSTTPVAAPITPDDVAEDDDEENEDSLEKRASPDKAIYYRTAAIKRHNQHRNNHGSPPVTWSAELAQAAMKSAQRCTFAHYMNENGLTYGQNLALGYAAPNIAGIITDGWYSEVQYYGNNYGQAQPDYGNNMENFSKWGHFTQVVWRDSSKIGCATWRCNSVKTSATDSTPMPAAYGGDVTYCNYQGPGNYGGEYANNVGRPKKNQDIAPTQGVNQKKIAQAYSKKTGQKWT